MTRSSLCFVIMVTTVILPVAVPQSHDDAEAVYNLIKNSSTTLRPLQNQSHAIEVSVIFNLLAITQVDEVRQELTCNAWLNFSWTDELHTWDSSLHGNLEFLHPMPVDIWRPRVMVSNSLQDRDIFKDEHAPVTILSDGRVRWYPGGIFFTNCKLVMTIFPFDTHDCSIAFLSNSYYGSELLFVPVLHETRQETYSENGEWSLDSSEVVALTPDFGGEVFTGFTVTLTLTRRPAFFLLNVVLPLMLLSLLSFMVFILPNRSGEKVTFGTTILLSQAVFLTVVTDLLPRNSDSIPLVLVYLFCVLILCSLAVAVSIIIVTKDQDHTDDNQVCSVTKDEVTKRMSMFFKKRVTPLEDQLGEKEDKKVQADGDAKLDLFSKTQNKFEFSGLKMFFIFVLLWFVLSFAFVVYGLQWRKPNA